MEGMDGVKSGHAILGKVKQIEVRSHIPEVVLCL